MILRVPPNADLREILHFAVLVKSEYAGTISIPKPENDDIRKQRLLYGLNNNPTIVFDSDFEDHTKFFNVIVGQENYGKIICPIIESSEAVIAGLESDPTIVPVTKEQLSNVQIGWVWDGFNFNKY